MYIPRQFEESNIEVMHELIRAQPLATLVTLNANGIEANHIRWRYRLSLRHTAC